MSPFGVPNLIHLLRSRVTLERLGQTVPGDVFYLVSDPTTVWLRYDNSDAPFQAVGTDLWFGMDAVGTGDDRQRIVRLHSVIEKEKGGNT